MRFSNPINYILDWPTHTGLRAIAMSINCGHTTKYVRKHVKVIIVIILYIIQTLIMIIMLCL